MNIALLPKRGQFRLSARLSRHCLYCGLCLLSLTGLPGVAGEWSKAQVNSAGDPLATESAVTWRQVGRGQMSLLWFELYRAGLFTPSGQYRPGDYPVRLEIDYLRDIDATDLLKATVEQWQHLGYTSSAIVRWQRALAGLWPDVQQGQSLAFDCQSADSGQFYFNGKPLGTVAEPGFADAFLAIWLSPDTSRPALRAQLLGEKTCDC
ncbi:chalcone isomerase family protein [Shewanella sp. GXUN23E]|uniref:chalcone isomerase family protein n=1 Tax=Shewanella sp. GXUN23E TaxID=3422498 RepID=UPI003D7E340C